MQVRTTIEDHISYPIISPATLLQSQQAQLNNSIITLSRGNSPTSSNSEIEKDLKDLDLNGSLNSGNTSLGAELNCKSNGSLSGASTGSATGLSTSVTTSVASANATIANGCDGTPNPTTRIASAVATATGVSHVKKRMLAPKARRVKFYRNGDRFYPGITIPVSNERYRSFESLFEDLTRVLEDNVKIPGAVRTIYTMCGKKISTLDEIEDGGSYVCSCNNENFKRIEYNTTSQPLTFWTLCNNTNNRLSKSYRPSSPFKNGNSLVTVGGDGGGGNLSFQSTPGGVTNGSPVQKLSIVHPRIVTLIRNGTKPRKIMRLLLNKRNSPNFEHVLSAITGVVQLDTGCVRKVFTLSGKPVVQLADFFGPDDIFFAYGTERVNNQDDFKLEMEEHKAIQTIRKNLRTACTIPLGPKPKMPVKSKNLNSAKHQKNHQQEPSDLKIDEDTTTLYDNGIDVAELPAAIRDQYAIGQIIGDGNFAVVLKIKDRQSGLPYALKIIDKSKCKGKEHYIDAEVRVMKKLQHPHIISLILDVDQQANMYLVLEYVSGGDLFDAITRVTRFSEDQSRVMIRHLASAMAYLHSMSIVHRDIKPENLLVELDNRGNVTELKLADFGLAVEVSEPLYAVCGTPTYVAPEILMETGYGLKIDVWAAGIILYILLCGFPPFVSPDSQQEPLFDAIIAGVYEFPDPYWSDIGDGVRDLITNMLQSDPDVRFSSEDILDHPWTLNDFSECSS